MTKNMAGLIDLRSTENKALCLQKLIFDKKGRIVDYELVDVTPQFEAVLGLHNKEIKGKRASEVFGLAARLYLECYEEIVASGKPSYFELIFFPY